MSVKSLVSLDELLRRLRKHVRKRYGSVLGSQAAVISRALREYLDREEGKEGIAGERGE